MSNSTGRVRRKIKRFAKTTAQLTTIKLHLLPDALDSEGLPRAALELPATPGLSCRRPIMLVFHSVAAAIATKRALEGGQ